MTADILIEPTRERLRKSPDWDTPKSDLRVKRLHHKPVGAIETMKRRGWLSDAQYLAFESYEQAFLTSTRTPPITGRYDDAGGGESELDPLDRKILATGRLEAYDRAIGYPDASAALRLCASEAVGLETVGITICGWRSSKQATAAAKTLLQSALYRLAKSVGTLQHFHRPM